jgi:hypothetical protein
MPLRRPSPTAPRASFHRRVSLRLTAAAPVTAGQSRFPCAGGHQRLVLLCARSTSPGRTTLTVAFDAKRESDRAGSSDPGCSFQALPLASVALSRPVGKVVGCPPTREAGRSSASRIPRGAARSATFEDLPGKWQAAILKGRAEPAEAANARLVQREPGRVLDQPRLLRGQQGFVEKAVRPSGLRSDIALLACPEESGRPGVRFRLSCAAACR